MGSEAHVMVVDAEPQLLERARHRIAELERLWSRFRPDSDLSRINSAAGQAVSVAPETVEVVRRAIEAWELTGGLFDPTVLPALEAAGYDRTFTRVTAGTERTAPLALAAPSPGCRDIEIEGDSVRVPAGTRLDLGGIGKGYSADLVAYELRTAGAPGVLVNLGGDARASGTPPTDDGWIVSVAHPWQDGEDLVALAVTEGAVTTSSRLRRSWRHGGRMAHHLIDPRTGAPATEGIAAVTVVAAQAHWAEILAKAVLIAGPDTGPDLLAAHGAAGLIALHDTTLLRSGGLERYEVWTPNSGGTLPVPAG